MIVRNTGGSVIGTGKWYWHMAMAVVVEVLQDE
jgi:hypothetical protein